MLTRDVLVRLTNWAKRRGAVDLAIRYNPVVRAQVFSQIERFARAGEEQRRRLADRLTAVVLLRARQTAYGERFNGSFVDWPILSKQSLRDNHAAFVRRKLIRIPAATGGTTGVPIQLYRSSTAVAAEQAFIDHLLAAHDVNFRSARIAVLRGDMVKPVDEQSPPFGLHMHGGRRLVLSSPHLCADTINWYIDALQVFQPDILWIWPTVAGNLLKNYQQPKSSLRIPVILTSSEVLSTSMYRHLEKVFSARVIDYYGQAERVCLAVSEGPEQYRFQPAYGRVELLPSAHDLVEGRRRHVRIVATGYWNDAMPLMRYDTGDFAVVSVDSTEADLRAVELGLAPFLGIAGRIDEFVISPDGCKIAGLNQIPREVSNVLQIQVVQEHLDIVNLRVLALPGFGDSDAAKLLSNARAKLPAPIRIRLSRVERLESNASGKTPFVIRRIGEVQSGVH